MILLHQKNVTHIVWCQKMRFSRYLNYRHMCNECYRTQNTHLLNWKLHQMWFFVLHLNYVDSRYTPELPGFFCTAFCSCSNSSVSGHGYLNPYGVQISGHIDIEFCRKLDKRLNLLYSRERNLSYTSICWKPSG